MNKPHFYGIYEFEYTPWWHEAHFLWCVTFLAILSSLFIIGTLLYLKKYAQKSLTPSEHTLLSLKRIAENLPQSSEGLKQCYADLIAVFKMYGASVLGWNLQALTELEIKDFIEKQTLAEEYKNRINEFLAHAHEIKFAPTLFSTSELINDIAALQTFFSQMPK